MSEPRNGAVRHKSRTRYAEAVQRYGSQRKAATALGITLASLQSGLARDQLRGYRPGRARPAGASW